MEGCVEGRKGVLKLEQGMKEEGSVEGKGDFEGRNILLALRAIKVL